MADSDDTITKPHSWELAVSTAYLRMNSRTQKAAAKGAGVGVRTLRRWEQSDWWPKACEEAADRWLKQLTIETRTSLIRGVREGDMVAVVKMAERLIPELAPPKQRLEHSGEVNTREMSDEELLERANQLSNRLAAYTNGNGAG